MHLIDRILRRSKGAPAPVDGAASTPTPRRRSVDPRDRLHDFWRHPDAPNDPERYLEPVVRSRFLLDLVRPYLAPDARILEIGCNVGRNLAVLLDAGYEDLTGIEINGDAIELLKQSYPKLGTTATFIVAPVEEAILDLPDGSFDLVYTMAVLEHIHPDSEWIFAEMVRISRSVLVTVEDEVGVSVHHTPRDYGTVFETLGARQVDARPVAEAEGLTPGFMARVFRSHAEDATIAPTVDR